MFLKNVAIANLFWPILLAGLGCSDSPERSPTDSSISDQFSVADQGGVTDADSKTDVEIDASGPKPSAIGDLIAASPKSDGMTLRWTAPPVNGGGSAASEYSLGVSTRRIRQHSFNTADVTIVSGIMSPSTANTPETFEVTGLQPDTTYYFSLRSAGPGGAWSKLSNLAAGSTLPVMSGKQIYVSPSGDDDWEGSKNKPLKTIAAACSASNRGDVIRVLAGTYENDSCSVRSGTALVSEGGPEQAVIDGKGQVEHLIRIWGDDDVVIDGFELKNSGGGTSGNDIIWIDGNGSSEVASNIKLRRLYVHDAGSVGDCIKVTNHVDGFVLENSRLHSAWAPASGEVEELLDMKLTTNATIRYNWFYHLNNSHEGAMAYSKTDCKNIVFENNIFGPQAAGASGSAVGGGWSSSSVGFNTDGLFIRNNLFIDIPYAAVGAYGARNEFIYNNVFFNCGRENGSILRIQEGGSQDDSENIYFINNLVIDDQGLLPQTIFYKQSIAQLNNFENHHNLYWNNGSAIPAEGYTDPNQENSSIKDNHRLANPSSVVQGKTFDEIINNFSPLIDSPAIDQGFNMVDFSSINETRDILGAQRPVGKAHDLGIFEIVAD